MKTARNRFAALVGIAWAVAIVDSIATNNPTLLGFITPVMLVVTTALFTLLKDDKNGKDDPDEKR